MVVWDLDETLCHTFFAPDDPSEARKDPRAAERLYHLRLPNSGDAYEHSSGWGTLRNNARQVIRALDANGFKQSVWSAGEHDYVHAMVDVIFKPLGIEPSIVLTRNHCDRVYSHADKKVTIVKNLNLLWNGYRGLNPSNTIIVDNRYDVCVYNSNNHIKVPDYAPSPSDPYGTDDTLRHLLDHLLGHKNVPDVRLITANWPLWHYLTLRGIASSLGQKIYYNIDDDTFVSARDVANMDTRVYRVSDLYLIVGMKKTVNYAYVSLTKKEVPKIPASVASLVQDHRKQDPILSMVYGISTDIQPEAPASEFVPPFAIDVQKIANALRNLSSDQCVNIMSGSKVKISKSYLMNEISTTPICLLRSKNALPQADIPRIFRYVEDELAKLKSSEKSTANASATTIRQNEETKLESLNRLNEQRKSLPRAESPQPSLPKKALPPPPVPKRPSERSRPSSPPKERPRIGTMEIDSLSEQLADIHMRVEEHRNTKSPIAPDIIDSINSSASRTRTRMLSPVRNELPQVLEDRVNAIMHDYEEAEEETLLTKFANASKRSPSLSPRSLSPAHSDREYSGNESEYSNDEEDYYSSGEADEAY